MPNYLTVYLKVNPEPLSLQNIQSGISTTDWWTLAEEFNIADSKVDTFLGKLEWREYPIELACLGERPLQIFVIDQKKELESQIAELKEKTLPAKVIAHLEGVSAIIVLELGLYQVGTLYEIFAFEIAYWLAETKQGLIQSHRGLWYDRRENRNKPIL